MPPEPPRLRTGIINPNTRSATELTENYGAACIRTVIFRYFQWTDGHSNE